jgi:hypothetical protein
MDRLQTCPTTCAQDGIIFDHKDSELRPGLRPEEEARTGSGWFVVPPSGGKYGWNTDAAPGPPKGGTTNAFTNIDNLLSLRKI